jgi:hypothetical protein
MGSFIKRLEEALDPRSEKQRGMRENALVLRKDLDEIVYHFKRLDRDARTNYYNKQNEIEQLKKRNAELESLIKSALDDEDCNLDVSLIELMANAIYKTRERE